MQKVMFGILLLVIIGVGVWFGIKKGPETKPATPKAPNGDQVVKAAPDEPEKEKPRPQSKHYVKPEEAPAGWDLFLEKSQMVKLNMVTEQMHRKDVIDPEIYVFFKAEMFNRDHWDVTRNNMANTLVWARDKSGRHPDPSLHEAFITMLEDEGEDPVWRDYCLQFLSEHLPNSSDPQRVETIIAAQSKGTGSRAGTAMVHMALQEGEGRMELNKEFNEQLAKQLEDPKVHRDTRIAILGVMGKRKDIDRLPLIRKYAKQDDDMSLKRTAIGAIGTIGASLETRDAITAEDRALVKAALTHKNGAVVLAAKAAMKRLATE